MSNKSQIEPSEQIKKMVEDKTRPITVSDLMNIKKRIYEKIEIRPYNKDTAEHEKSIRWKRTSTQILNDGYVYEGKACTDLVVLFLSACNALRLETRFVKLKKENWVHSVAEIKLEDGWYIFDVSNKDNIPIKGEVTEENQYKDWKLWKKGRDAWDIDLVDFDSIKKIKE
jgi:hypothetical protein